MKPLFDPNGIRLFTASQAGMISSYQARTVARQFMIRRMSVDTAFRQYRRILDIISNILAEQNPIFRELIDNADNFPDETEFREGLSTLLRELEEDALLAPLVQNIGFPFVMPQQTIRHYGRRLLRVFFPILGTSLEQYLSNQEKSHRLVTPLGPFLKARQKHSPCTFTSESRYAELIEKLAHKYLLAIFFPALPGFCIKAALQQMSTLPSGFVLSGAATTALAIATWPQYLGKLRLSCSAIQYEHDDQSVIFDFQDNTTTFNSTHPNMYLTGLSNVHSGLIYIGNQ